MRGLDTSCRRCTALLKADTGDLDGAIAIARATLNELTNSGEMLIRAAASAALVATLLMRGNDTDVHEAEGAIDRLAAARPTTDWLSAKSGCCGCERYSRKRAVTKLPTASIGTATAPWRHRLASKGISRGPRRCHDGGYAVGSGDVSVHRY